MWEVVHLFCFFTGGIPVHPNSRPIWDRIDRLVVSSIQGCCKCNMLTCPISSEIVDERSSISALHVTVTSWSKSKCRHAPSALKQMIKAAAFPLCMVNVNSWSESTYPVRSETNVERNSTSAFHVSVNSWSVNMSTCPVCSETNVERNSTSAFHVNVNSWSESTCQHALSTLEQKLKETALQLHMSMSLVDLSRRVDMRCLLWNRWWKKLLYSFACQCH